jgi:regulator of nonsense transcripts 3
VGPPALEFAPYHRMPGGRRRNDTRQGTIDQDQEFKDFLESLTNPLTKPPAAEDDGKKEKAKTTPLIEALREKKANKDKPQSRTASKHGRGEAKEDAEKKILAKSGKEAAAAAGDKNRRPSKAEKAAREAVKVLNKEAASKDASTTSTPATSSPAPERKRGNAAIAKSMLQRDLGIGPAANRRRGTKREITPSVQEPGARTEETPAGKQKAKETSHTVSAAASDKVSPSSPKKERPSRAERRAFKATLADKTNNKHAGEDLKPQSQPKVASTPAPTILKKPQAHNTPTPPRGPAASRGPPTEPAAARTTGTQQATPARPEANSAPRPAAPTPSRTSPASSTPTGRQAFLKHANASQGITEPLIEEALKIFGAIEKVEIDKRKGFAYVDFADSEGLAKALAGSPVKVAQGAVQVLERKEKVARVVRPPPGPHPGPHPGHHGPPTGPARGRGGFPIRGRGRGGARGHAASNTGTSNPASPAMTTVAPAAAPAPAPAVATGGDSAT